MEQVECQVKKMVFLSYPHGVKGYRLWDPLEKATINRDVVFDENSVLKVQGIVEEQQEVQSAKVG